MRYNQKSDDTPSVITLFGVSGRLKLQIVAQGIDVSGKCFFAFLCHAAGGAWLFTGKTFFDGDVACFGKFFELYAQVAGSCLCLLLDVYKVGLGGIPLHYIFLKKFVTYIISPRQTIYRSSNYLKTYFCCQRGCLRTATL